jgi:uncharacterized glyoxalase superfamily protein PhnB
MAVKPVPDGYHTVTPYLMVSGVAKLLEFVKRAFGARVTTEPMTTPDGKVAHVEVQIGDSRVMMGESSEKHPPMPAMLNLYVPDCDAVYQQALKAGGASVAPPTDHFYGDRSAGVRDASGNLWYVSTHKEDVSPEEMRRRMAAAKPA